MDRRKVDRQVIRTPSFYEMMKRNNPHDLNPIQLRCALISACLSVPIFAGSLALIIFEHQACPDGASSNPDHDPLTDDNPNHCKSWYQCIDHETLECTAKDPSTPLLVVYYLLLVLSLFICFLFLHCTKCLRAYNECAHVMGTDEFRSFVTIFLLLATALILLSLGTVLTVEGARSCPPDSWKVSTHNRLFNPNHCTKCVQQGVAKQCVDDWDVNASLLELGVVMIVLSVAVTCGGCWYLLFRRQAASLSLDDVEQLDWNIRVRVEEAQRDETAGDQREQKQVDHLGALRTSMETETFPESPLTAGTPMTAGTSHSVTALMAMATAAMAEPSTTAIMEEEPQIVDRRHLAMGSGNGSKQQSTQLSVEQMNMSVSASGLVMTDDDLNMVIDVLKSSKS